MLEALSYTFSALMLEALSYTFSAERVTVCNASLRLRTAAIIAISSLSLLTAEPTPTPAAPAAIAMGAVTSEIPDAHSTGILTAREMAWAAARVGVAFSIKPILPG